MDERRQEPRDAGRSGQPGGSSSAAQRGSQMPEPAEVKEQVQQKIGDLKEQVAGQATGRLEEQKAAASGGLNTVAHAFRQTGEQLRNDEQDGVARYVDQAAERIEEFSHYLGQRDMRELARDAERFARREPALFLGGAFAVGLIAARFLKSSGAAGAPDRGNWRGEAEWYGQTATGARRPMLAQPTSPVPYTPTSQVMRGASSTTPATPPGGPRATTPAGAAGSTGWTAGRTPGTSPPGDSGTGAGMATSSDVIVGGPPIDDAIVGGPPIDRGRETR